MILTILAPLSRWLQRRATLALAVSALAGAAGCAAEAAPAPPAAAAPSSAVATAPAPNASAGAAAPAPLPARDPVVARRLVEEERALLIDVRTPGEFAAGNIPGAINIPVEALEGRLDEVKRLFGADPARPIVVYCRSGRRSGIARDLLLEAGYARVINFGGLAEWK